MNMVGTPYSAVARSAWAASRTLELIDTKPIELTGKIAPAPSTDPFGRERLGLSLETSIDRNDYSVSWNAPNQSGGNYLADDVKLIAELAFVKQEG